MLVDDNGVSCFVDDLSITSWVDDLGQTLACGTSTTDIPIPHVHTPHVIHKKR